MKTILAAGSDDGFVRKTLTPHRHTVINKKAINISELSDYISESGIPFEFVMITDGALKFNSAENRADIHKIRLMSAVKRIVIVTRDKMLYNEYKHNSVVFVLISRSLFLTKRDVEDALFPNTKSNITDLPVSNETTSNKSEKEKKSLFSGLFRKSRTPEEDTMSKKSGISFIGSKFVIFTGHRGAGATSTAINTAAEATRLNLKTIIVDFDIDFRSINLYFSDYMSNAEKDDDISCSLMRTLAKPQDFSITSFPVTNNLRVVSLGFEFHDKELIKRQFTAQNIVKLISVFKNEFNFIAADFPIDLLAKFPAVLSYTDAFALCVENNLYSMLSTIRSVNNKFDNDSISLFNSKCKLVVTKYDDENTFKGDVITPDLMTDLIAEFDGGVFTMPIQSVGTVPFVRNFDKQIETDVLIVDSNSLLQESYSKIVHRLLSGV